MRDKAVAVGSQGILARALLLCLVTCLLVGALGWPARALADTDGVAPYEEFNKQIQSAEQVAPLTDSLFGDSVDLYTGSTEFDATDVSLPGNNALPVQLSRRLVVEDRRFDPGDLGGFGDWELDVPYIEGTFVTGDVWTVSTTGNANDRCSIPAAPVTYYTPASGPAGSIWLPDVWNGNQLHIPGSGDQELLVNNQSKSPAYASRSTYPWVTTSGWKLRCTSSLANGYPGEGFIAVSPSGVQYTFNWMIVHAAPYLKLPSLQTMKGYVFIPRSNIFLVATEVEDRFGNWVKYAWSSDHLTGISSSDGRSLTINWSGSTISTVTSAAGTWTYAYGGPSSDGEPELSSVLRPDSSRWTYSYDGSMAITPPTAEDIPPDQYGCQPHIFTSGSSGAFTYTIGAPSGASGAFSFGYAEHYRSTVPKSCTDLEPPGPGADADYPQVYNFFYNFTILSKQISGPGLPAMTWNYRYVLSNPGYYLASQPWNDDSTTQPYIPSTAGCSDTNCVASENLVVTGPTNITQYTFGVEYAHNEGQLLATQIEDLSGNVLKTTTNTYVSDTQATSEPFPDIAGQDLLPNYTSPMGNRNRPTVQAVITQDGATFTTATNTFDAFARTTSETGSSSLGYSKTDTTAYADDLTLWVLGMVKQTATNGIVDAQTNYNTLDQPTSEYAFGKLVSTKQWNSDGTLHTVTDGDGNVTTLTSWSRGLPQVVTYADGHEEGATVNGAGWITSITDEAGYTTNYQYDPMGRIAEIDYPSGDDTTWNATDLSFTQVTGSEFGIPGGHWKQVVHTGNGYAVTYFDALWRPLVTEHYDAGNESGTLSQAVTRYDAGGRTIFTSYPLDNLASYTTPNTGTHSSYDALGRVTAVTQDSELGGLTTTTQYLSGFETKVTDPRLYASTTTYQAYGEPGTQWPATITSPEGELTVIERDVFGKPLSVTRTGTAEGSPEITRSYVYDANQQLCKRIEPETGATAFGYDGAGNLSWSAAGLALPDTGTCDASTAQASGRVVTRTYDPRNRIKTLNFPDGVGNQWWAYTADGLPLTIETANATNGGEVVTNGYQYDHRRLLAQETLTLPGVNPWTVKYEHDANAHLSLEYTPTGQNYIFGQNALGQPSEVAIQGVKTYVGGASYWPDGKLAQYTYANGIVHTLTENTRGLPATIEDTGNGTTPIDQTLSYDADGDPTAISDTGNSAQTRSLTYDGLDRLQSATVAYAGTTPTQYQYDVLDNLAEVDRGAHTQAFQYNADNQLSAVVNSFGGLTENAVQIIPCTYDAQGNLATRGGVQYTFDYGNRLRQVSGEESGYLYDGWGRRVEQVDATTGEQTLSMYTRDGQLIYQQLPGGAAKDYQYLGNRLVAIRDYANGVATQMQYEHTDAEGTIVAQTDANAKETETSVYDSYGALLNRPLQEEPGYTGQMEDALTGLTYMQQRYYDPSVGRFLSIDPVTADGNTGGNFNRYWYASDNPYANTDPDGEQDEPVKGGSCSVAGNDDGCQQTITGSFKKTAMQDAESGSMESMSPGIAAFLNDLSPAASEAMETAKSAAGSMLNSVAKAAGGVLEGIGEVLGAPVTVGIGAAMMPTSTAADDTPDQYKPPQGSPVYRVCGGGSNCLSGQYWTPVNPFSARASGINFRDMAGLPNNNLGIYVTEGRLVNPSGVINIGPAAPLGTHDGIQNRGGLIEYQIPHPETSIQGMVVEPATPAF